MLSPITRLRSPYWQSWAGFVYCVVCPPDQTDMIWRDTICCDSLKALENTHTQHPSDKTPTGPCPLPAMPKSSQKQPQWWRTASPSLSSCTLYKQNMHQEKPPPLHWQQAAKARQRHVAQGANKARDRRIILAHSGRSFAVVVRVGGILWTGPRSTKPWQDPDLWTFPVNPHLMYIWCNIY
jgi:hypothetical protein